MAADASDEVSAVFLCRMRLTRIKEHDILTVLIQLVHIVQRRTRSERSREWMISLNYRDTSPIYEQIKNGLKKLIVSKVLKENDKLPSVRSLAMDLAIHQSEYDSKSV